MTSSTSARTPPKADDLDGLKENEQVEEDREVLDVVEVVLELFQRVFDRGAVAILDLGPAGNARLGSEAMDVEGYFRLELTHEVGSLGSRTYQAHLAAEDIGELRNFVQPGPAQDAPDARYPWVAVAGPHGACLQLGVAPHGAEFDQPENSPSLPQPLLTVEDRPWRVEPDEEGDQGK